MEWLGGIRVQPEIERGILAAANTEITFTPWDAGNR